MARTNGLLWSRVALAAAALVPAGVLAQPATQIDDHVVVLGRWDNPFGYSFSASQGVVGAAELEARPLLRPGEILEAVPGLIVTQHSGTGKSNQMFLRGFNLDHGTDFATWVDGMPVNLPTHGHGQGYTDLNFLIPELVERLEYRKGALLRRGGGLLVGGRRALVDLPSGSPEGISRPASARTAISALLAADSVDARATASFSTACRHIATTARGTTSRRTSKRNNCCCATRRAPDGGEWNVALMGYDAQWNSADQVPRRAVESGLISPLGSIDTTFGGETSRYSLSGSWSADCGAGPRALERLPIDYDSILFSNFTYFLDDPVDGDQFEQLDDRTVTGGELLLRVPGRRRIAAHVGAMLRYDDIGDVGLFRTREPGAPVDRARSTPSRSSALGLYYSNETQLNDRLRATLGVRADRFDFDVASDLAANSGARRRLDARAEGQPDLRGRAPRPSSISSAGQGLSQQRRPRHDDHHRPCRRATRRIPSIRSSLRTQFEVGFRSFMDRRVNVSAALWYARARFGAAVHRRCRQHRGQPAEPTLRHRGAALLPAERSCSRSTSSSRSRSRGSRISIPRATRFRARSIAWSRRASRTTTRAVCTAAFALRYFGPRPLIEDGSVKSDSSTIVNAALGFRRERLDVRARPPERVRLRRPRHHVLLRVALAGRAGRGRRGLHFHPHRAAQPAGIRDLEVLTIGVRLGVRHRVRPRAEHVTVVRRTARRQ